MTEQDVKTSWQPRQGGRCRVLPTAAEREAGTEPPAGVWWCLSPAPTSGRWWLCPHDEVAHEAASTWGKYLERHVSTLRGV